MPTEEQKRLRGKSIATVVRVELKKRLRKIDNVKTKDKENVEQNLDKKATITQEEALSKYELQFQL